MGPLVRVFLWMVLMVGALPRVAGALVWALSTDNGLVVFTPYDPGTILMEIPVGRHEMGTGRGTRRRRLVGRHERGGDAAGRRRRRSPVQLILSNRPTVRTPSCASRRTCGEPWVKLLLPLAIQTKCRSNA